ncbi:multicopper oxidase domain-containing protein [Jannaschia sp. S6380]|uniref:multicopper oxidase family protein n=1 Tax=Jannaschia sp. S6380 TaxID=2926408 RepID=UPI001FF33357|nr:multicopper oxidase domain-containing protein [Jannaschia sp. S6380]MCK0166705.1 multicopper oxidase domain-containing protein [Jannaschia sp. S6380]
MALPTYGFAQTSPQTTLTVGTRTLEIMGRAATVMGIMNDAGTPGLVIPVDAPFDVRVRNTLADPTVIHWHGLTPPFAHDGSNVSQAPVAPGGTHDYLFDVSRSGTNWMHSHFGLQEAQLLAAPLIVESAEDASADRQTVTIMLHDFSFTPPEELLAGLRSGEMSHIGSGMAAMHMGMVRGGDGSMAGMDHGNMNTGDAPAMDHGNIVMSGMAMDLNDIAFDAFLANDRDLSDPEIVPVERSGRVRLRIINAASSSNFWLDLGNLQGRLLAVDGNDVLPIDGTRFEIAMAQRLDIEVSIPSEGGAFPIIAQLEGAKARTGIVLATASAAIERISGFAEVTAPPVLLDLERQLVAASGLPRKPADAAVSVDLTGDMQPYAWGFAGRSFDNRAPVEIVSGQRVDITLRNRTMMSHPMHLHGHHFQVVGLGRARLSGAIRDTVLVPAMESVTIAFDADNPGEWPLHCHNMYHMAAGMMTTVTYA